MGRLMTCSTGGGRSLTLAHSDLSVHRNALDAVTVPILLQQAWLGRAVLCFQRASCHAGARGSVENTPSSQPGLTQSWDLCDRELVSWRLKPVKSYNQEAPVGPDFKLVACYLGLVSFGVRWKTLSFLTSSGAAVYCFPLVLRAERFWRVFQVGYD